MKTNETYRATRELPAFDAVDEDCRLPAGTEYRATAFDRIVDVATGEVFRLPRLQAANPTWYFGTGFNPRRPEVTIEQLAREAVRCNEGLQVDLLYATAIDACPRAVPTYNTFTATLSQDPGIEMRDQEGRVVRGTGHGKRFCTYHVRRGPATGKHR